MTLKTIAFDRLTATLAAGAASSVFGTLYTVPVLKRAFIKEILASMSSSAGAAGKWALYILKSGDTDLTSAAAEVHVAERAQAENKRIAPVAQELSLNNSAATGVQNTIARNTIMEAGDKLNAWVYYPAITPGDTQLCFIVSGDESSV